MHDRSTPNRRATILAHVAIAAAVYPALLLTQRGHVAADSKPLLFLDAGRFLARAPYLWDPTVGLGSVTHQNIGYLLPMGPWFWATEQLGLPVWISQRLWLGTVLFAAGAGVLFLARTVSVGGTAGPLVAGLAYALSPFVAQYATHLSVLLLPFAGLPWLVAFTIRAAREGGWRWPAWFALVVALVGTINATALVCIVIGPLVALAIEFLGHDDPRRVVLAALRIGVFTLGVSLWWIVALALESRYGIDVLDATESLETVSLASSTPEILRGLGYWFLYGRDTTTEYLAAGRTFTVTWVLPVTFVPVILAFLAAVTTRWWRRGLFVALVVIGIVLAVGAHPYDSPSPYGRAFRAVLEGFDTARAMRSITRVAPLVVLGLAVLLGAGVAAALRRSVRLGRIAVTVAVVAVVLAMTPLWTGDLVSSTRTRPESVPAAWRDAAEHLDASGGETRVLEIPGIDFAAYDWGYTNDSITRGLMDRPTAAREVVLYGTPPSADLLAALDRRIQDGTFQADELAPIARLLAAGSILVRGDLDTKRYALPDVAELRRELDPLPAGLSDDAAFDADGGTELTVLEVEQPRALVRAAPADEPLIVSGSGDGLVDAAAAGLLRSDRLVVYSGSLAGRPETARQLLGDDAVLVVTDSNRKRAARAKTLYHNDGYTERVGEQPLREDDEDARFELFPEAGDDARTVTVASGPTARATSYGNPLTLEPSERPMLAIDGDPQTAWRTGDFWNVLGERLRIELSETVRTDRITIAQPTDGNRSITRLRVTLDDGEPRDVTLGPESRTPAGQVVRFPEQSFNELELEVVATDPDERVNNGGLSGVGITEVTIPGVDPAVELVRMPSDLVELAGARSTDHPLTYLMTRLRAGANDDARRAPELRLARELAVPTPRAFTLTGTARGDTDADAACRDDLLTVDGQAVPLRVGAARDGTSSGRPVTTCDDEPIALTRGTHTLVGAGVSHDLVVDQLALSSAAGGGAAPDVADEPTGTVPSIRADHDSPTAVTVDARDVDGPFWLVLGESHNEGWRAELDGESLGPPLLVDGYANGWYVDPDGASTLTVSVAWTPQRWVWIGLACSAIAIAGCLVLALWRRRVPSPTLEASTTVSTDALPAVVWPPPSNEPATLAPTVVLGLATTVAAILASGVVGGVVVGAAIVIALRVRRGLALVDAAALLAVLGASVFVVAREVFERFPADFAWPASFDEVHTVALVGVLLLGVDALVTGLRARARRR